MGISYKLTRFSLLVFLSLFSSLVFAASTPEFWKLSRGSQLIWILGSVHVADDSFYPLPNAVNLAFKQAERLYLEVDISTLTANESSAAMATAMLPTGEQLKNHLSKQSYHNFLWVLKQDSLSEMMFQAFKPWFAAMLLAQVKMQRLGYQAEKGIDKHFSEQAHQQGKPIYQFETFTEQMTLLAKVEPFQQDVFDATVEQLKEFDSLLKQMMTSWKTGNSRELQHLLMEQSGPKDVQDWLQTTLLSERNANWIAQLEQQKPPSAFIVVGALHVGGKEGIVSLLQKLGFSATLVK